MLYGHRRGRQGGGDGEGEIRRGRGRWRLYWRRLIRWSISLRERSSPLKIYLQFLTETLGPFLPTWKLYSLVKSVNAIFLWIGSTKINVVATATYDFMQKNDGDLYFRWLGDIFTSKDATWQHDQISRCVLFNDTQGHHFLIRVEFLPNENTFYKLLGLLLFISLSSTVPSPLTFNPWAFSSSSSVHSHGQCKTLPFYYPNGKWKKIYGRTND